MYYDILKASKVKAEVFPDYWTQLFAEHVGGKGEWKVVTGVLPLTFTAKGGTAADWVIEGNDENGTENLLKITAETQTVNNVQITINADKTVTVNGTASGNIYFNLSTISFSPGTYTLSSSGVGTIGNGTAVIYAYDGSYHICDPNDKTWALSETKDISFVVWISSGKTVNNLTFKPMFVQGSTAPDHYIPYQQGVGVRTEQLFDFQQFAGGEQTTTNGGLTFTRDNDTIVISNSSIANYPLVFLNDESGLTVPQLTQGQTYSGKLFISNAPSGSNIYVDVVGKNQGGDWTWIKNITASGNSFTLSTAYDIYGYRLICQGAGLSYENTQVKFVLTKGSTAPSTYVPYGYQIPLAVSQQGQPDKTVDIYIGDSPLTEGETVSKTSTGQDIELFEGENTVSTTLYNKPEMKIKYK